MKHRILLALLPLLLAAVLYPWNRSDAQAGPSEKPPELAAGLVPTPRKDAPFALTASDGTGLKLVELKAQAVMEGPLAFTELHLTFENPLDRVLEGRFQITLPDKAAISRFAMKIEGQWQEAEVVERQAARVAYEDFLHRRQDPALLESAEGNEFSARIFPIPAGGRKELILSYSQELPGDSYRLPLQGLPRIGRMELGARVATSGASGSLTPEIQAIRRENFLPEGDFVVSGFAQPQALQAGDYLVARVRPDLKKAESVALDDLLVLVDTSASRSLGAADQAEKVADLLTRLPSVKKLTVACFDQEIAPVFSGVPSQFQPAALLERRPLGATDLAGALRWAAKQGHRRLLLVTDGVSTAGSTELKAALTGGGLVRLDVLLVGGIRDKQRMESLVGDGLKQDGMVLDGDLSGAQIAQKLALEVTSGLDVSVADALWVWPRTLDNLQPGDERLVYAQLKKAGAELKLSLGGQPVSLTPAPSAAPPLLQRQAVVARVARLESLYKEAAEPGEKDRLAAEIVDLSTTHRVLSDKTALLVLETEQDYARFNIDRNALSDILVVGAQGLEVRHRDEIVVAANETSAAEKKSEDGAEDLTGQEEPASPGRPTRTAPPSDPPSLRAPTSVALPVAQPRPAPEPATSTANAYQTETARPALAASADAPAERRESDEEVAAPPPEKGSAAPALEGPLLEIKTLLAAGKSKEALGKARQWQQREPGNVLALIALGECLQAAGLRKEAARAYGSLIDLFPARADLRRFAGSRLQQLGADGLGLAVDSFQKASEQRPDHVSSHRYLALALARQGRFEQSFTALEKGIRQNYPEGRFRSYERILRDDLGIVGAAWIRRHPEQKGAIEKRLAALGAQLATQPSLRFVLTWETDANDVDFHIHDAKDGHAYYSSPRLPSGGELYGDVTTGYGPECFAITGKPNAFPYRLQIHYYSRGPMGYGMGQLEILQHDGQGDLMFEERPYIVMQDGAYVDLGIVEQPLRARR
jgi:tetratricopeptide (TPR) repeat protein